MNMLKVPDIFRLLFGVSVTISNLMAVGILLKCKKMSFQLRIMTIQLAITDVIRGIVVIMIGLHITDTSIVMCHVSYHTQVVICNMTCFTITAMSCDRFLALSFPLRYRYMVTARRAKYIVIVLWVMALATSLLILQWMTNTVYTSCKYSVVADGYRQHATIGTLIILINIFLYAGILWALYCRRDNLSQSRSSGREVHMKQQKKILLKILAITLVFVLTFLPFNVMWMIFAIDFDNRKHYMTAYFVTMLLWLSNSMLNPCVYVWQYPECRKKLLVCCHFWRREGQRRQATNETSDMHSLETASSSNVFTINPPT